MSSSPSSRRSAEPRFALGLETIYEGYLLHYGRPRLFAPPDGDTAILLGDYLYAHGLVRVAAFEEVEAVADLADLISLCAQLSADGRAGDGEAWAATAALLGAGMLDEARSALRLAGDPAPLGALARAAAGDEAVELALRCAPPAAALESRPMAAALVYLADAASEGIDVIPAMLIVGLVFVGVILPRRARPLARASARRDSR